MSLENNTLINCKRNTSKSAFIYTCSFPTRGNRFSYTWELTFLHVGIGFPTRGNWLSYTWELTFLRVGIAHASRYNRYSTETGSDSSLKQEKHLCAPETLYTYRFTTMPAESIRRAFRGFRRAQSSSCTNGVWWR